MRQNGWQCPDDSFKCIFLNENVWISIKISLKFVPKGPINNIPASEPMMVGLPTHIYASLGHNELSHLLPSWLRSSTHTTITWDIIRVAKFFTGLAGKSTALFPQPIKVLSMANQSNFKHHHYLTNVKLRLLASIPRANSQKAYSRHAGEIYLLKLNCQIFWCICQGKII